jgi:DNA-binding beta-propeller fold protein YncE
VRLPARPALIAGLIVGMVLAVLVATGCARSAPPSGPGAPPLPLRVVGRVVLPGDGSRFDYASLDVARGLLFVAHLGANEVVEVDLRARRVVRVIPGLSQVHGVLVVPGAHRLYATATGENRLIALDEDTGALLWRSVTGEYPDGLAYDPLRNAIWTTNESGGSETVVDATSGTVRGRVELGGEVGNVAYDETNDQMLVDAQETNELAVIDPARLAVVRRVSLPGCAHDHGLSLDIADRLAFVACDQNAALLTVGLNTWRVAGTNPVGADPDVAGSSHRRNALPVMAVDRSDGQRIMVAVSSASSAPLAWLQASVAAASASALP